MYTCNIDCTIDVGMGHHKLIKEGTVVESVPFASRMYFDMDAASKVANGRDVANLKKVLKARGIKHNEGDHISELARHLALDNKKKGKPLDFLKDTVEKEKPKTAAEQKKADAEQKAAEEAAKKKAEEDSFK